MEAHERWNYDNITKVQKLKRLVALCHQCHQATHMGLAQIKNKEIEATNHLKKVRNFLGLFLQIFHLLMMHGDGLGRYSVKILLKDMRGFQLM